MLPQINRPQFQFFYTNKTIIELTLNIPSDQMSNNKKNLACRIKA